MSRTIGRTIQLLRKERRLTQEQLSKHLGVTRSAVTMYENDKKIPSVFVQEQICDYFNIDMNYLHGKSDIRNSCRYTTDIFSFLTDEELEKVISYARFIYESRDK